MGNLESLARTNAPVELACAFPPNQLRYWCRNLANLQVAATKAGLVCEPHAFLLKALAGTILYTLAIETTNMSRYTGPLGSGSKRLSKLKRLCYGPWIGCSS